MKKNRGRKAAATMAPWDIFLRQASFALDCQTVIGLRMMRFAAGGEAASRGARRMVSEKVAAFTGAQIDAALAFPLGGPEKAAAAIESHYRRAVRSNRRRLSR